MKRTNRPWGTQGFTLFELAFSLVLIGILGTTLVYSAIGFLQIYQSSHTLIELTDKEGLASTRILREIQKGAPGSFVLKKGQEGLSFDRVQWQGIINTINNKKNRITDPSLDLSKVIKKSRLFFQKRGEPKFYVSKVKNINKKKNYLVYKDVFSGEPDLAAGDRYWIAEEQVSFARDKDQVVRRRSLYIPTGKGESKDSEVPLVDSVSRFSFTLAKEAQILGMELYLLENENELGGNYRVRLPPL